MIINYFYNFDIHFIENYASKINIFFENKKNA